MPKVSIPAPHVKDTCSHESSASVDMMRSFVTVKEPHSDPIKTVSAIAKSNTLLSASLSESMSQSPEMTSTELETINPIVTEQIFTGYLSDLPTSDKSDSDKDSLDSEMPKFNGDEAGHHTAATHPHPTSVVLQLPPLKRQ